MKKIAIGAVHAAIGLAVCLNAINSQATEMYFDAKDCSTLESANFQSPVYRSRITVTRQDRNFFAVTIMGGVPDVNTNLSRACVNPNLWGSNSASPVAEGGYAVYVDSLLYVFVHGLGSGGSPKMVATNMHTFVFAPKGANSFVFVRHDWQGYAQGQLLSGSTDYSNSPYPVVYTLLPE